MLYRNLSIALLTLSVVTGIYYYGFQVGKQSTEQSLNKKWQAQVTKAQAETDALRQTEHSLSEKHASEILDANENIDTLLNNVRTRTERVYVRTQTTCAVPANTNAQAGSNEQASRAELHPETVRSVAKIGQECDRLAIDFNYLQGLYAELLNKGNSNER